MAEPPDSEPRFTLRSFQILFWPKALVVIAYCLAIVGILCIVAGHISDDRNMIVLGRWLGVGLLLLGPLLCMTAVVLGTSHLRALRACLVASQSADVIVEGYDDYDGELSLMTGKYHLVLDGKGRILNESLTVEGASILTEDVAILSSPLITVVLHRPNQRDYEFEIAGNAIKYGDGFTLWSYLGRSDEFKRRLFALCRDAK